MKRFIHSHTTLDRDPVLWLSNCCPFFCTLLHYLPLNLSNLSTSVSPITITLIQTSSPHCWTAVWPSCLHSYSTAVILYTATKMSFLKSNFDCITLQCFLPYINFLLWFPRPSTTSKNLSFYILPLIIFLLQLLLT